MKNLLFLSVLIIPCAFAADDTRLTKDAKFLIHSHNRKHGGIDVGQLYMHQLVYRYKDECKNIPFTLPAADMDARRDDCVREKIELLMQKVEELGTLGTATPASEQSHGEQPVTSNGSAPASESN